MRTAYAVGLLEADPESPLGVRLVGIDVFSEPDPTTFGGSRCLFVLAECTATDYGTAVRVLLTRIGATHPWLAKAFNGRTRLPLAAGGAS